LFDFCKIFFLIFVAWHFRNPIYEFIEKTFGYLHERRIDPIEHDEHHRIVKDIGDQKHDERRLQKIVIGAFFWSYSGFGFASGPNHADPIKDIGIKSGYDKLSFVHEIKTKHQHDGQYTNDDSSSKANNSTLIQRKKEFSLIKQNK
jgi:hypothetical protein